MRPVTCHMYGCSPHHRRCWPYDHVFGKATTSTLRIDPIQKKFMQTRYESYDNVYPGTRGSKLRNESAVPRLLFSRCRGRAFRSSERRNLGCPLSGFLRLPHSAKGVSLRLLQHHDTSSAIFILGLRLPSAILLRTILAMQRCSPIGAFRSSIRILRLKVLKRAVLRYDARDGIAFFQGVNHQTFGQYLDVASYYTSAPFVWVDIVHFGKLLPRHREELE